MIMPHFTSDATKDDFDYLRKRSGMSLNCLDRLYSLGMACADAQRELVVTEKNLCDAMDSLHKSERELAAYKQAIAAEREDLLSWEEDLLDRIEGRVAERMAANA